MKKMKLEVEFDQEVELTAARRSIKEKPAFNAEQCPGTGDIQFNRLILGDRTKCNNTKQELEEPDDEEDDIIFETDILLNMHKNEDYKNNLVKREDDAIVGPSHHMSESNAAVPYLNQILKYVLHSDHLCKLLYPEEMGMLHDYFSMPVNHQIFCFTLYTRDMGWYNVLKVLQDVNLPPDSDTLNMITELTEKKFINTDYSKEELHTLLKIPLLDDLRHIMHELNIPKLCKRLTKKIAIEAIVTFCQSLPRNGNSRYADVIKKRIGPCVQLGHCFQTVLFRLHLLYSFTNEEVNSAFKLRQFMDQVKSREIILPLAECNREFMHGIFEREQYANYSSAWEHYLVYKKYTENKRRNANALKKVASLVYSNFVSDAEQPPDTYLSRFFAGHVYATMLSRYCKDFIKAKSHHDLILPILKSLISQHKYCPNYRGAWYHQLATVHLKYLDEVDLAAQCLIDGLKCESTNRIQRLELLKMAPAIIKRKKSTSEEGLLGKVADLYEAAPKPEAIPKKHHNNSTDKDNSCGAESLALDCYERLGYEGLHCEGSLVITIFFMLFWDIVYDLYVPQTYVSEIQILPLDFCSRDFYRNRKASVDKRVKDFATDWAEEELHMFMSKSLALNSGKFAPLCSLEILSQSSIIYEAIQCIGRVALSKICELLAISFHEYSEGMPDLFVWHARTKKCKFVEVKRPSDDLSPNQLFWLDYLISLELDVEIFQVDGKADSRRKEK